MVEIQLAETTTHYVFAIEIEQAEHAVQLARRIKQLRRCAGLPSLDLNLGVVEAIRDGKYHVVARQQPDAASEERDTAKFADFWNEVMEQVQVGRKPEGYACVEGAAS